MVYMSEYFSYFISSEASTLLLPLVIILCAFIFEDLTIVIAGVLVADGLLPIPLTLISLYIGMVLGDTALYFLGFFSRAHPRLAQYIDHDFTAPFIKWLKDNYAFKIFSGHFVPGFRFTTYVASGFFHLPLRTYIPMSLLSGLTLMTTLFTISYWFGSVTSGLLDHIRWGIAGAFLLILFLIGRHNFVAYHTKKNGEYR